ncbi:MAG: hypothetical protein KC621_04335 [Myxococcales bacterium]|nr:hypothetical protein [Myxococcales bacterium]
MGGGEAATGVGGRGALASGAGMENQATTSATSTTPTNSNEPRVVTG